jgi:cytochrome c oxidase subunit 3
MAGLTAPPHLETPGGGGPPAGGASGDPWGGRQGPDEAASVRRYKTGMWLGLGAMVMLFAAFSSAYVVRKGVSIDWRPTSLPPILWANTVVLLASSLTIARASRDRDSCLPWLGATAILGALFLAGQYVAWRRLAAAGVYMASNPSSSFFYLLTGAHGLHLLGGVLALGYVLWRASRPFAWAHRRAAVECTALYWHFMDGLWIYLLLLLLIGG